MSLPTRHPNDLSLDRQKRTMRFEVSGIKKHTPNRRCVRQEVTETPQGQRVKYLHVTKGWRSRLIIEPSFYTVLGVIKKAQRARRQQA